MLGAFPLDRQAQQQHKSMASTTTGQMHTIISKTIISSIFVANYIYVCMYVCWPATPRNHGVAPFTASTKKRLEWRPAVCSTRIAVPPFPDQRFTRCPFTSNCYLRISYVDYILQLILRGKVTISRDSPSAHHHGDNEALDGLPAEKKAVQYFVFYVVRKKSCKKGGAFDLLSRHAPFPPFLCPNPAERINELE